MYTGLEDFFFLKGPGELICSCCKNDDLPEDMAVGTGTAVYVCEVSRWRNDKLGMEGGGRERRHGRQDLGFGLGQLGKGEGGPRKPDKA